MPNHTEYSTDSSLANSLKLKALLSDDRLTDAHRQVITVLMQISPDTMPYAELAKRSGYRKSTAQKLTSELGLVVADHGLRVVRRSRGREVWVGIEEYPPTRGTAARRMVPTTEFETERIPLSAYREFVSQYHRREYERWLRGEPIHEKEPTSRRKVDPMDNFAEDMMRAMIRAYEMRITLQSFGLLSPGYIARPPSESSKSMSFEDVMIYIAMMRIL